MTPVYNFNAGPAILPHEVLAEAQQELLDYHGIGMSVLEISHRSKEYEAINSEAEARIKRLLGIGDDFHVLFLQGGASLQFAMLPMNFLPAGATADYVITGAWAEKAYEEAKKIGQASIAANVKDSNFNRMPSPAELQLSENSAYVHICSNETIQGTQWQGYPDVGGRPLVIDMSSDILSRPIDMSNVSMIYAGAQKNLGPSGATVVILRKSFFEQASNSAPTILRYATHVKNNSLYNTPPVFSVYLLNLTLGWIEANGGLEGMQKRNAEKAATIYNAIERSGGFYTGHAVPEFRSNMNITFRLPSEELEKQFVNESKQKGMVGLAGHRSVGGIRASVYNAMSLEGCQALADYMDEFLRENG
jgi:phosphoserine aminotransferase